MDWPCETGRVSSPAVKLMLPSVIVRSSSSARWRWGGGPPSAPTTQSSANIEPPDSSPVTRNVYMSPGPHHERPVSPAVVCTTFLPACATNPSLGRAAVLGRPSTAVYEPDPIDLLLGERHPSSSSSTARPDAERRAASRVVSVEVVLRR